MRDLLSAHSEVLSVDRRWKPDWYTWFTDAKDQLDESAADITTLQSSVATNTANIATNTAAIATNTAAIAANTAAITALQTASPAGLIYGLGLSNNGGNPTTRIDIASGRAAANTSFATMILSSTLTKRLDANWAVGTNNGGLDTGAATNAVYYVWLIARSDTGVVDALFSLSASSPTMPASYDRRRRIGSIRRSGGSILAFIQTNDRFIYTTSIIDASEITVGTSRTLATVSVPPNMLGLFRVAAFNATSAVTFILQPTAETDAAPSFSAVPGVSLYAENANGGAAGNFEIVTDGSSQIAARADVASSFLTVVTRGWIDERERFG